MVKRGLGSIVMLEKLIRKQLIKTTKQCEFKKVVPCLLKKGFVIISLKNFPKELAKELKKKGNGMGEWLKECGY